MNAMTMAQPTAPGTEVEAVTQHNGRTTRVTIREIREYAYRALIVSGASPGEAATAAGQVVHAELHADEGVAGLVSDLARGPWPRSGLTCTRRTGPSPVLEVDGGARSGELRVGAPLVDLAAGEPGSAIVVTTADVPLTSLLDEILLAAAEATGTTVTAIRRSPRGRCGVRHATQEGDLAHGLADLAHVSGLGHVEELFDAEGLLVVTGAAVEPALTRLRWSSPGQRAERRREAALRGVEVDEAVWRELARHAHRFLVPEIEA